MRQESCLELFKVIFTDMAVGFQLVAESKRRCRVSLEA